MLRIGCSGWFSSARLAFLNRPRPALALLTRPRARPLSRDELRARAAQGGNEGGDKRPLLAALLGHTPSSAIRLDVNRHATRALAAPAEGKSSKADEEAWPAVLRALVSPLGSAALFATCCALTVAWRLASAHPSALSSAVFANVLGTFLPALALFCVAKLVAALLQLPVRTRMSALFSRCLRRVLMRALGGLRGFQEGVERRLFSPGHPP